MTSPADRPTSGVESGRVSSRSSAPTSSGQGLLADVDGQSEVGALGCGDQLGSLGSGDADGDRLARVVSGGSPRAALLGCGHVSRIGDTETIDKGELSCHDNYMTNTSNWTPTNAKARTTFATLSADRQAEVRAEVARLYDGTRTVAECWKIAMVAR